MFDVEAMAVWPIISEPAAQQGSYRFDRPRRENTLDRRVIHPAKIILGVLLPSALSEEGRPFFLGRLGFNAFLLLTPENVVRLVVAGHEDDVMGGEVRAFVGVVAPELNRGHSDE